MFFFLSSLLSLTILKILMTSPASKPSWLSVLLIMLRVQSLPLLEQQLLISFLILLNLITSTQSSNLILLTSLVLYQWMMPFYLKRLELKGKPHSILFLRPAILRMQQIKHAEIYLFCFSFLLLDIMLSTYDVLLTKVILLQLPHLLA